MQELKHVAGNIGAGKTTYLQELRSEYTQVIIEPVDDNPVLSLYYAGPKRYALAIQSFMLAYYEREFRQARRVRPFVTILTDFGVPTVFTATLLRLGLMSEVEADVFWALEEVFADGSRENLVTTYYFLDVPPKICLGRIKERGRACEQGITLEYLNTLDSEYRTFLEKKAKEKWTTIKVIKQ